MSEQKTFERREFLKVAGAAVALTTTTACTRGGVEQTGTATWRKTDRSLQNQYPTLSLKERDLRFEKTRKFMQDHKVEGLVLFPSSGNAAAAAYYLTNDVNANVVFPLHGDPVALNPAPNSTCISAGAIYMDEVRGNELWIKDWRFGKGRQSDLFDVLKEKKLTNTRVGVVGVVKHGHNTHDTPAALTAMNENPLGVTFVELFDEYLPVWLTKSEEEIVVLRKASWMCEVACEAGLHAIKPGVSQVDVFTAIIEEALSVGGQLGGMNFTIGPDTVTWGGPRYLLRPQKPLTVNDGDVLNIEIVPHYGGVEAQAQLAVGVGKVSDLNVKLGKTAREMFDASLKAIRPGVTFREVCDAMQAINAREGFWHYTPNIHSMPVVLVSQVTEGVEQFTQLIARFGKENLPELEITYPDVVLQAGMAFQPEPNSCSGRHRVNIGGNVLCTATGSESLNTIPCEMRFV